MDKTFYLTNLLSTKKVTSKSGLRIAGYANTSIKDRTGDIVLPSAWAKGVDNYRLNPVLLYQHKADSPIGKVNKIKVDSNGIYVEATISDAAETQHSVQSLIKDNVLKAFSVGFRINDSDYDDATDSNTITEVELLEISIVSIPANQNSLFSVRKSFDNEKDYYAFCDQFSTKEETSEKVLLAGLTTKDNEHYHAYELDENNDGVTTYTSHGHSSHSHRIEDNVVQEENDHTHEIESLSVIEGDEEETKDFTFTSTLDLLSENDDDEKDEDEEDEELDPMIPIPFENYLNYDTSKIRNGDYVKVNNQRHKIIKIATVESPFFQLKEVDINGDISKEDVLNLSAISLSIVNDWDIDSGYDLTLLSQDISIEITNQLRDIITDDFTNLVNMSEHDLYITKQKDEIKENKNYQNKLNKLMNLVTTDINEWTNTDFIVAKNICDMINNLKAINPNEAEENKSKYDLALELHGHKVIADNSEENNEMGTQDAGEIKLPIVKNDTKVAQSSETEVKTEESVAKVKVAEPKVAELVEKAGEAIMTEASVTSDEVKEIMKELSQYKEELSALTNSKMIWDQSQRSTTQSQFSSDEMANAYLLAKAKGLPDNEQLFTTKIGMKMKAVTTVDAFLSNFSRSIVEEMEEALIIAPLFRKIQVDARTFRIPVADEDTDGDVAQYASGTFATGIDDSTNIPTSNQHSFTSVDFTPHKFMAMTHLAKDEEEDNILPVMGFLRTAAARRLARAIDKALLRGRGNLTGFTAAPTNAITVGTGYASVFKGLTQLCEDASLTTDTASTSTKATPTNIATARAAMGKYGVSVNNNDLVYITSIEGYNELVQTADFRTVDTFGPQATYHTGTVGAIWGIPVVMTEFMDDVASTAHLGVLVFKPGFLIAERRGIIVETEYEPRQQVTAIYMSTRYDMHALTTVASAALSSRYSMANTIQAAT